MIHINTDAITNSILNGVNTNTLAVTPMCNQMVTSEIRE